MSFCTRSLTSARSSTQASVTEGLCQSFGLLSGWSERLSGTETLQPPTQDGKVRLRLPSYVSFLLARCLSALHQGIGRSSSAYL